MILSLTLPQTNSNLNPPLSLPPTLPKSHPPSTLPSPYLPLVGTGREVPMEQRSVGSHHLPSYLPSTPFSTIPAGAGTGTAGGTTAGGGGKVLASPKHQSSATGGNAASSSSYPLPSSSGKSSSSSSSSTAREQTNPYYQQSTARSSIGKYSSTTYLMTKLLIYTRTLHMFNVH